MAFPHLRILPGRGEDRPAARTREQVWVHEERGGYLNRSELGEEGGR
jgi:hypothetical protein